MNTPLQIKKNKEIEKILVNYYGNPDIAKYIIKILEYIKEYEKNETLEYHMDRWNNITGSFFEVKNSNYKRFSYILDDKHYIIKKDHINKFYNNTGLSYQLIDLLQELIKISHDKEWLEEDDKKYSILANKIMIEMNK
tara:strand:+ start:6757 stop:7170 length:414 start_codon:yes stop_codon:yes gene_type:complete